MTNVAIQRQTPSNLTTARYATFEAEQREAYGMPDGAKSYAGA